MSARTDICDICTSEKRANGEICVVEDVADLWAMERAAVFKGRYHVLGGTLSALDGIGPDDLRIPRLLDRVHSENISEVILALNATVDGQTTAHYIADQLDGTGAPSPRWRKACRSEESWTISMTARFRQRSGRARQSETKKPRRCYTGAFCSHVQNALNGCRRHPRRPRPQAG